MYWVLIHALTHQLSDLMLSNDLEVFCSPNELADNKVREIFMKKIETIKLVSILILLGGLIVSGIFYGRSHSESDYIITQYASTSGNQSLIYTLEDDYGHLIIVDGGWKPDVEQLLQVIDNHSGKVDAWIITHPHQDHVEAFNTIMRDHACDIQVDKIYVSDFDYETYKEEAQEWDGFQYYQDFLDITKDMDNITELSVGDELDVDGLHMKVYSSYSNKIDGTDAANDGSIVFELFNQKQSMLFCGDTGVGMSQTLLDQWGDELQADYIQMGHHGNGGLSEEFYRMVHPSVAFFDAPNWLMYPEEGSTFTTPKNREIVEGMGATVYSYSTTPNTVILE